MCCKLLWHRCVPSEHALARPLGSRALRSTRKREWLCSWALGFPQTNTKVELFKLDETLPPEMFAQLCRVGGVSRLQRSLVRSHGLARSRRYSLHGVAWVVVILRAARLCSRPSQCTRTTAAAGSCVGPDVCACGAAVLALTGKEERQGQEREKVAV